MKKRVDLRSQRRKAVKLRARQLRAREGDVTQLLLDCLVIMHHRVEAIFSGEADPATEPMKNKLIKLQNVCQRLNAIRTAAADMEYKINAGQAVDEKNDSEW